MTLSTTAEASAGTPHWPAIAKARAAPAESGGPPYGPVASRVSTTRQGVTVWNPTPADGRKVAETNFAPSIVTVHGSVPKHPPPAQPAKREPASGVAVRVTSERPGKEAAHSAPQAIPSGAEETLPLPDPILETARV